MNATATVDEKAHRMLVLHGFWSPSEGLCLWAEDSERAVKSPSQALRTARAHPFAAPADVVAELQAGKPGEATLLLPSLRSTPLDSPELIRITPRPTPRSRPVLLPWAVPVITLDAASALVTLDQPAEVRHGASLRYLADLAAFARELALRGRVLPALRRHEEGPVAAWRPHVQGRDVVALNALVTAMPPVCRAQPDNPNSLELVNAALAEFTDAAVRERLPENISLLPPRRGRRPQQTSAAEAWLAALTAPGGRFDADPHGLEELVHSLQPWDDVGAGRTGPARATFRLTEIDHDEAEDPQWRLEFLLQSIADPSLLIPAEQAWTADGSLRRWLDRPQELLLTELGRASRIYPELAPGLRQARPCALELDTDGAYHFLSTAAGALDEAGFGVQLPSWWDRRRKLGLALTASSTPTDGVVGGTSRFGRDQLVDFSWQLALDDETLTEEEIAALAETKAPLVRLRGQWVAVDPERLRRGLDFLRRTPAGQKTAAEVLALAVSHPDDVDTPLDLTAVRADGWLGDLLDGTVAQSLRPIDVPDGFHAELRPYQQRGLSWLTFLSSLRLGACLADDMGLGKTVQLLALEASQRTAEPGTGPTLLLCPMSLVGNWEREAAKFAPGLRVYAHHGSSRLHGDELRARLTETDLIVTTYSTATRDLDELAEHPWHRLVLDEAQAVKNSLSRSAKAVRRLEAGHRIALTGTPLENRLAELWS
ncbi:MAG: DEAD/DEAH box helicase, partial [Pseudonocardiaceae bacterium]